MYETVPKKSSPGDLTNGPPVVMMSLENSHDERKGSWALYLSARPTDSGRAAVAIRTANGDIRHADVGATGRNREEGVLGAEDETARVVPELPGRQRLRDALAAGDDRPLSQQRGGQGTEQKEGG